MGESRDLFLRVRVILVLSGSNAGCGGIKPASSIVIHSCQTTHPLRCSMCGAR